MEDQPERRKVSRRGFVKATAAGAAAAAALAAAPSLLVVADRSEGGSSPDGVTSPLVAYVRDASRGEVVILMGTKEVVRKDLGLVARLVAMAG